MQIFPFFVLTYRKRPYIRNGLNLNKGKKMKKYAAIFAVLALLGACSEKTENQTAETTEAKVAVPQFDYENIVFSYDKDTLPEKCDKNSGIVCAVENTVKCAVNPQMADCDASKMPKFVFLDDENIIRPTHFDFKITKIKPIDADSAEIYTVSNCNGAWFGLCRGDIIFVVRLKNGEWVVKDLYSIEKAEIPDLPVPEGTEEQVAAN